MKRFLQFFDELYQDVHYGLRLLMRSPGFALLATSILTFGIGATGTIFSFVSSLVMRPLAIESVQSLVQVVERFPGESERRRVAYANFLDWKNQSDAFDQIAAFRFDSQAFAAGKEAERVLVMRATTSIFPLLRTHIALGRSFSEDEDRPGAEPVAVLSNAFWRSHFGGDPTIVGQTVRLDGHTTTIVGILASDPDYFGLAPVWTPLALSPASNGRSTHFLSAVARLRTGVRLQQAQSSLDVIASRLTDNQINGRQLGVSVLPFQDSLVDFIYPALSIAMAAAAFLLLVTCANIGNLLLARGSARTKEISIRLSLGATRYRIGRQLLTESAILCCLAAVAGLAQCRWSVSEIVAMSPESQRLVHVGLDTRVVAFVAVVALVTAIGLGLLPALRTSRATRFTTTHHARNVLIVAEVASAFVLLIGTALLLKSYLRVESVSPGIRTTNVLTVELSLPQFKYSRNSDVRLFYSRLIESMKTTPGLESTAIVSSLPFAGRSNFAPFDVKGAPITSASEDYGLANQQIVSANYFATADVRILAGRTFNDGDRDGTARVAMINEELAKHVWKNQDPIGSQVRIGPPEWNQPWLTVVGVSRNVMHYGLDQKIPLEIYVPFDQVPVRNGSLLLHTSGDLSLLAKTIRAKIFEIDPDQAVSTIRSMEAVIDESLWQRRVLLLLMLSFGAVALSLSSIGVYGVIAHSVQQRQTEFGIRIALGARPAEILKLAIGEGMRLVLTGIAIGLAVGLIAVRALRTLLYEVGPNDPFTFSAIVILLAVVAFIAAYIPARRATSLEPLRALRVE